MSKFRYVPDKCNPPPVEMGKALVFADAMPGMNDIFVRPFGWTEYESAYRHQYVPDPCPARRPCVDPCRPKGVDRKPPPRQFTTPCCKAPRITICNLCHMAKCRCRVPPPWDECKEKVVVYDPDSVRNLLVHGELKNEHPFVISEEDFARLLKASKGKTKAEKEAEMMEELKQKEIAREECREQAEEMRLMDYYRFNDSISPQAREDMDEILCRAKTILRDDEPEVRTINKVILAAKVQAIREAQLAEKKLIKCEQAEEERRVLAVLEQDKAHALIPDEDKEVEVVEQKKKDLMRAILLQLNEKEAYKFLEKEQLECERGRMRQIWEDWDIEEMQKRAKEREKKHSLGIQLLEDQMLHLEVMREAKALDRREDEKMIEWQKKKAEDEEKMEKEKALQKKLKAMQVRQVLETQKRSTDDKALRDELRAKRHVEEQERVWRKKERDALLKKHENMQNLREGIISQISQKQEFFCEQAAYDKAVYDKIYNIQDDRMEEERKKEEDRQVRNARYRYDLREQIHKYQMRKVQERKEHFIEGITLRKGLAQRDQEIKCTMETKLDELRESNLPEKYLNYVRKAAEEELKPEWSKSMSKK